MGGQEAFLLANFNNLDKLEPRIWRLWAAVLAAHPRAVLWLQQYPPAKANRVRKMAEQEEHAAEHGAAQEARVPTARLVMTPFFKSNDHIGIKATTLLPTRAHATCRPHVTHHFLFSPYPYDPSGFLTRAPASRSEGKGLIWIDWTGHQRSYYSSINMALFDSIFLAGTRRCIR